MIYTYIQQTVLATKPRDIKVPSQMSLTDCLRSLKYSLFRHYYQLLQRKSSTNHHMVVRSIVKHTLPPPSSPIPEHLEFPN